MASNKNPEQRSATGDLGPLSPPSQPTGNEVYDTSPARTEVEPTEPLAAGGTREQQEAMRLLNENLQNLQQLATAYYEKVGETASELGRQATQVYDSSRGLVRQNPGGSVLGAFAVGVILGVLSSRS